MKFGTQGQLIDEITCVTLLVNRFRGYRVLTPQRTRVLSLN